MVGQLVVTGWYIPLHHRSDPLVPCDEMDDIAERKDLFDGTSFAGL